MVGRTSVINQSKGIKQSMSITPNKRMVYIWPENLHYYDNLANKSEIINKHLAELQNQLPGQTDIETELEKKLKRLNEQPAA